MLYKGTLIGLLVVRAAMPAPGVSKDATPVYQPTFVPSQYQSESNPYPFDRALNINAKGEALIVSCRALYSGAPCSIYLWSPKAGVVRTPYGWTLYSDCIHNPPTLVPVRMNERGEVAMNYCGDLSTWSAKSGKTNIATLMPGTTTDPLVAFNDRGEIAGTTFVSPYYKPYYASASTGVIILPVTTSGQAIAMNKHGEMIGHGFYWSLSTGLILIPAAVRAIADDGTVVGVNGSGLVLWDKHKGVTATAPLAANCTPLDITSKGLVVGACSGQNYGLTSLWTWSAKSGFTPNTTLPGTFTVGAINDSGQVVGTLGASPVTGHAFTWSADFGFVDLDSGRTDRPSLGLSIADDGTIGGSIGGIAVVWTASKH